MNGKEFVQWMESVGISLSEAANLFGVSEQTLYNWRSTTGVPDRKLEWVLGKMSEYTQSAPAHQNERVSLEITRDQFTAWNRAALLEGKIIYDWAADVLDEAAAEAGEDSTGSSLPFNPLSSLKVAEPGTPYGTQTPKDKA